MIITEDDQARGPGQRRPVTAVVALARVGTVMAWDPEGGTLIAANIVGQMPWTARE